MAIGSGKKRPWKKDAEKKTTTTKEEGKDTFVFVAGIFENPKSLAGSSYKDVEVETKTGEKFTIPKGVRFMVLESKLENSKTPYALYVVV